jgi:hypothetical protein
MGDANGDWNNADNWCGGVPDEEDNITITSNAGNQPWITTDIANVCDLVISEGAMLSLDNNQVLNVYCNFVNNGDFQCGNNDETVVIAGDVSMLSGGDPFNNLVINANATLTLNDNLEIKGNLIINGEIQANSFSVSLIGSSEQRIGGTGQTKIKHLIVNNTSTELAVVLESDLEITDNIEFSQGILNTGDYAITLENGATFSGGNIESFIDGAVITQEADEILYPVGDYVSRDLNDDGTDELYKIFAPIRFIPQDNYPIRVEYCFNNTDMPDWWEHGNNMPEGIHHVSDREYWKISSFSDLDDITVYWKDNEHEIGEICPHGLCENDPATFDANNFTVVYSEGGAWVDMFIDWESSSIMHDEGYFSTVSAIQQGAKTVEPETRYITFGAKSEGVLPVDLLGFEANCLSDAVEIVWQTATEKNNDFFTIEKGNVPAELEELIRMPGVGNSTVMNEYVYLDYNLNLGTTYYRLLQTDFDGTKTVYDIISVSCTDEEPLSEMELMIFPNPVQSEMNITVFDAEPGTITFEMYDQNGKVILFDTVEISSGSFHKVFNNMADLQAAIYNLRVTNNGKVKNYKVTKL